MWWCAVPVCSLCRELPCRCCEVGSVVAMGRRVVKFGQVEMERMGVSVRMRGVGEREGESGEV